jgi:hypothetical protein
VKRALLLTMLLLARPAAADEEPQPFGKRGHVAFVIDDLFGYHHTRYSPVDPSLPAVQSSTYGNTTGDVVQVAGQYTRFGVHVFIGAGRAGAISIGTALEWTHWSTGTNDVTLLGFEPRLGFVVPFDATSAVWLRAGIGYQSWDRTVQDEAHVPIGGELTWVYTPVSRFGLLLGPTIDVDKSVSVTGRNDNTPGRVALPAQKRTTWGLALGVLFDL